MPKIVNQCFKKYLLNNLIYIHIYSQGFPGILGKSSEKVSNMHCHAVMRTRTHSDIVWTVIQRTSR